jgi:hypothetical protein
VWPHSAVWNRFLRVHQGIKENGTESDSKINSIFDVYIKNGAATLAIELKELISEASNGIQ